MLLRCVGVCLVVVLFLPAAVPAQVYSIPTPAPTVSAADRDWYQRRLPVFYAGDRYYPAGPRYHFDADIMVPAGTIDGVPIYVDTSVQPYSQILVPIGGGLVQPYERRREGVLAGTTGSHAPEFPVDIVPWEERPAVGQFPSQPAPTEPAAEREAAPAAGERLDLLKPPGRIETILEPEDNRGIWIMYEGQRWRATSPAVPFEASRYSRIGEYHGFPVLAARGTQDIFIPAAQGMLAVYRKDEK